MIFKYDLVITFRTGLVIGILDTLTVALQILIYYYSIYKYISFTFVPCYICSKHNDGKTASNKFPFTLLGCRIININLSKEFGIVAR